MVGLFSEICFIATVLALFRLLKEKGAELAAVMVILVLVVVPSHCMRSVAEEMKAYVGPDTVVISASKGIENKTHATMTDILSEVLPHLPKENFAVLSGPSFAKEVAAGVPTVVAAASTSRTMPA